MSICVENLTKYYGKQLALNNLSFEVQPGEILGFLGPNGAGKSTTLRIITGYLPPSSGTVRLGEFLITDSPREIQKRIGYLPEHNPLYREMYVREFLSFSCQAFGIAGALKRERIEGVIAQTGLSAEQHKQIRQLSKGYRQRVGLAQALIHDPEVLILDEPTTGLDPNQLVEIRTLIKNIGAKKTIIFSSHILSEVEALADRVLILHKGNLVANESLQHLRSNRTHNKEVILHVELNKAGFDPSPLLHHEEILACDVAGERQWKVRALAKSEIRDILFEACVKQGYVIYGLQKEQYTLEHTFAELTKD